MSINTVIEGLRKAPLTEEVRERAIRRIQDKSKILEGMFDDLRCKPPSAHQEWYMEIAIRSMGLITPILEEGAVSGQDGTNTIAHIYASIAGEDPSEYLETAPK